VAAILALAAAIAWFIAASHPMAVPGPAKWAVDDQEHPVMLGFRSEAHKLLRGAQWNRIAAALTGCSAFAMFLSWLLPLLLR
jgi:hypothetical protein